MNTIDYSVPRLCGPCGDVRCAQYGCIKKMFVETPKIELAQPNITQPYNTNHVAALEMIVKLAGENAVLQKENKQLREAFQKYFGQSEATNTHTPLGEK